VSQISETPGDCSLRRVFLACIRCCKRLCVDCDGVPRLEREVVLTIRTRRLAGATSLQTVVAFRAAQARAWRQATE